MITGPENLVKMLIEHGVDVNAVNKFMKSPLVFSLISGQWPIKTTDYSMRNQKRLTKWIAILGFETSAELLILNGSDVNAIGQHGSNALMNAAHQGFEHIVKMLIDRGAGINAIDDLGNSALINSATIGENWSSNMNVPNYFKLTSKCHFRTRKPNNTANR